MSSSVKKKYISVALIVVLLCCVFIFTACNKNEDTAVNEYGLFLYGLSYDAATLTATVYVSTSGAEKNRLSDVTASYNGYFSETEFWFKTVRGEYTFSPSAIYSAVNAAVTQDDMIFNGVTYTRLKVAFCYDTIYKSTVSNGKTSKIKTNKYRHILELDQTEEQAEFSFTRKTQNSANWYTVLLSAGIVLTVAAVGITVAAERNRWRKKI